MESKMSKEAILDWSKKITIGAERSTHKVEFIVDSDFGVPGAITVSNKYHKEIFLESITIEGVVQFVCNSWVQAEVVNIANKRIFFSNKLTDSTNCSRPNANQIIIYYKQIIIARNFLYILYVTLSIGEITP
ncbi:hypothetical protein SO802_006177 [Lithocarpus litseifolius]|uniref:PLAT domain-containing protein n=1 Tax=Lithocarpus litseifolius TaxID=425828 RepID=A0AAW2DLP1_9ROSI